MERVLLALDRVIKLLEEKVTFDEGNYEVIDELTGNSVFKGSWDDCTNYVDEHTPDESNTSEFKFTIKESE